MIRRVRLALTGLRARLVLWYLALFVVALVVAVVSLRQLLVARLADSVTSDLTQEVEELRLLVGGNDPTTGEPFGNDVQAIVDTYLARNVPSAGEGLFFVVDGEPYQSTPGAPVNLLEDPDLLAQWSSSDRPEAGRLDTVAGPARWVAVPITRGDRTLGTFAVARFYQPELEEIDQAVRVMAALSAVVLALAAVIGWLTVGRALAPIGRLTRTARGISDSDLSQRLPVSGHDEVAEMSETFNAMLDRLEAALVDQRRFLDDVGHELRTPLTIVRGHLELMPEEPAEREQTVQLCLDELDRVNRYVSELILLSRAEKPDFLRLAPVDLGELTDGMQARAVGLEPDRSWRVEARSVAVIEADPDRLNQAWLNLVSNAVQHTVPGGVVALGSTVVDGVARLWVSDDGPGVPLDEQSAIFDRFQRGGDSRTRRAEGTGLGLAIVTAIARAHGGRVRLDSRPGEGARFTLEVPVSPPAERAGHDEEEDTW